MLKLFHVDIESFAVAGAFVIFLMSLEMILDIEIFKNQGPIKEAIWCHLSFLCWQVPELSLLCFLFGRICQYQYHYSFSIEHDLGLLCSEYDWSCRTFLGKRWYLYYS